MSKIIQMLNKFAYQKGDSKDVTFKKLLILLISISCSLCGILWSTTYYYLFGFGLTMILPLLFVVIIGAMIIVSH